MSDKGTTEDDDAYDLPMETGVLRALADAADDLTSAKQATRHGFVHDYCENALREIRKAMRLAIGGDDA